MKIENWKLRIIFLVIVALLGYLFFSDFSLFRKLIGYNTPLLQKPVVSEPNDSSLSFFKLPGGFKIDIFASDLENPKVITFDPSGRMLVSETDKGRIIKLEDTNNNGKAEKETVILEGLNKPHGLAFYDSGKIIYLYVAETNQVARYPYDAKNGAVASVKGENIANLPADGRHFTRTIAFGPNYRQAPIIGGFKEGQTLNPEKLYISVGSSCDACVEDTWKRAAILESDPIGTFTAEFAGGLRNAVFFTFHPITKEIWATEMGRDNLGDNLPPDEINIVKVAGPEDKFGAKRYGWPFCYGNKVRDQKFNPEKVQRIDIPSDCTKTEPPVIEIPAHSAPLGLAFITDDKWPAEWKNDLLVAYHGSWNRSEPTGYKIVRYDLDANGNVLSQKPEDFISGWLSDKGKMFGRPVDLKFGPDGSLYISDDATGIIYKVNPR